LWLTKSTWDNMVVMEIMPNTQVSSKFFIVESHIGSNK